MRSSGKGTRETTAPAAYSIPLPPGNEAYAHVDGLKMKEVVEQITAISRKSRDDGNQYWGRIPSTPYDRMTQDWVIDQFQKIGLKDVRRQDLEMEDLWYPESWKADFTVSGKTTALKTHVPDQRNRRNTASRHHAHRRSGSASVRPPTSSGREIKGKAVFIYSVPTPGGRDHSRRLERRGTTRQRGRRRSRLRCHGISGECDLEPRGRQWHAGADAHHQPGRRQRDP